MHLLEISGLSKEFDGLKALDGVTFWCDRGEILGVIGPNGAGKTTLFNMITGIYPPSGGEIRFEGRPIPGLKTHQISRLGIGRTFQIVRPFQNMDVFHNVLVALGQKYYPSLRGCMRRFGGSTVTAEAESILERSGLLPYRNTEARNLPLGFKKRLEIARALAMRPKLLLLDEPSAGLRFEESSQLMVLIRSLREEGIGILLIEHNMAVIMDLCKRIVVLDHGTRIAEGTPEEIRSNPQVIEAYLGKETDDA
ncbi:MAG: ABC transporter ATP-binding protein [Desulfobacteraceae bacterium]|nr:MAG: ABC transporter ATP-binding protein [Desulfobacteraceae bacterium]